MSVELTLALDLMSKFEKANDGRTLKGNEALAVIQAYAAIAQAEATRPRWVQLGTRVINLAQVAYINLQAKDFDGNRRVEIGFAATTDNGSMALMIGGDGYDQAVVKLSNALYGCMVGADPDGDDK